MVPCSLETQELRHSRIIVRLKPIDQGTKALAVPWSLSDQGALSALVPCSPVARSALAASGLGSCGNSGGLNASDWMDQFTLALKPARHRVELETWSTQGPRDIGDVETLVPRTTRRRAVK